jgi:hypothetical protein
MKVTDNTRKKLQAYALIEKTENCGKKFVKYLTRNDKDVIAKNNLKSIIMRRPMIRMWNEN